MEPPNTSSSGLAPAQRVDRYTVKLDDGQLVERTVEQLVALPDTLRSEIVFSDAPRGT